MTEVWIECQNADDAAVNVIKNASCAALAHFEKGGDINVILVDNAEIHALNLEHRGIDRATDVLSFPANEGEEIAALPDGFLGDIVISLERAFEQAEEYGHSNERELAFLTVHGTLHLLGYDHMTKEQEDEMFSLQKQILDNMGLKR
ncbi:MAG: rRNA maturation RNase YbeY [Clostridia bacterium]|nr:rRNA maturation RNase YbeY [Clostridia bacterium]